MLFIILSLKLLVTKYVDKNKHKALEIRNNKKYIKQRLDYAYRLVEAFSTELQSQNFGGNNDLSTECVALE